MITFKSIVLLIHFYYVRNDSSVSDMMKHSVRFREKLVSKTLRRLRQQYQIKWHCNQLQPKLVYILRWIPLHCTCYSHFKLISKNTLLYCSWILIKVFQNNKHYTHQRFNEVKFLCIFLKLSALKILLIHVWLFNVIN